MTSVFLDISVVFCKFSVDAGSFWALISLATQHLRRNATPECQKRFGGEEERWENLPKILSMDHDATLLQWPPSPLHKSTDDNTDLTTNIDCIRAAETVSK